MEWLTILMLEKPKTVGGGGNMLFNAGGLATIVGIWGVLALRAIAIPAKLGISGLITRSLADAWPAFPTWRIPESTAGFVISIGIAAPGVWLVMTTSIAHHADEPPRLGTKARQLATTAGRGSTDWERTLRSQLPLLWRKRRRRPV